MKKVPVSLKHEVQTMNQYFDCIICSPFLNGKSSGIETYLDNPSEPALPAKTDYTYIIPQCFLIKNNNKMTEKNNNDNKK